MYWYVPSTYFFDILVPDFSHLWRVHPCTYWLCLSTYFELLILLRACRTQPDCLPAIQAQAHALNQFTLKQVYSLLPGTGLATLSRRGGVAAGRQLHLQHLQYHDLISEGSLVTGVGCKTSDGVGNDSVDVANRLGGLVVGWLAVGRLEGRELQIQQRVNGVVLAWVDLQMLHSLTTSENIEHVRTLNMLSWVQDTISCLSSNW